MPLAMSTANADFSLDPRLATDTIVLADWPLCRVCLMNDSRFAWLILVPRRRDVIDIDQLTPADQTTLWSEVTRAMTVLRATVPLDKLNVGALGNIVRQLHVHIVARSETDAAWPGPVWGAGSAKPYDGAALEALCLRLKAALHEPT